jgi:Glycerol-3-phosphate dehydrogenase
MNSRSQELKNIPDQQFDLCVIGGGATGSACALDAHLRGIRTVLLEGGDFAGGTSSAATKIVHGGVRYLEEAIKGSRSSGISRSGTRFARACPHAGKRAAPHAKAGVPRT